MKKLLIFLMLSGLAGSVWSGDLVIKSGVVFKDAAIMGAAPNGIRVCHADGVAVIPVNQFPDSMKDVVNKFAKDIPAAKKAYEAKKKAQEQAKKDKIKKNKAEKARQKKSAEILKKQAADTKKLQDQLMKLNKTSSDSKSPFTKK